MFSRSKRIRRVISVVTGSLIGAAGSGTGNLSLPDTNATGIRIESDDVTVDVNGFGILGTNARS